MRILHRYLVQNFFWPFLFCSCLFVLMFIIVDALNNLDDFLRSTDSLKSIAVYYASMIPVVISHILPSSVVISCLYTLSNMNKNNEIIAMKSHGVSGYHILLPVLYLGLIISLWLLALNETITPKAAITASSIKQTMLKSKGDAVKERSINNVAMLTANNLMVYARELKLDTYTLHDVIILDHYSNLKLKTKSTAKRGVFRKNHWIFYDVQEYEMNQDGNIVQKPEWHDQKIFDIRESPGEFLKQSTEPQFMSFKQLQNYLQNSSLIGFKTSNRLLMELYQKTSQPFICFIMLLVSAPLALRTRRGGAMVSLGMGLFVIATYYSLIAFSSALGKGGIITPIIAAWLPNTLFFCLGLSFVRKFI